MTSPANAYANQTGKLFAVAPMMDWTDRHCRYFHRLLTKEALLYSEMVVADALIHGDVGRHLDFSEQEHPVALQLGGSDPAKLVQAAKLVEQWGYDEVNLNVGCPSDRVQSGTFGAVLMREPELVASCVAALKDAVSIAVTVKCRIGVDNQDPHNALFGLAEQVFDSGSDALWVHARKAWLQGLSPKENRDIPPLDYQIVRDLKAAFPFHFVGINGGIQSVEQACTLLVDGDPQALDGVMIGRSAYQNPSLLGEVDCGVYGKTTSEVNVEALCRAMMDYTACHIAKGGRVHHVTRHMIGLFQGLPGARRYRQILSVEASRDGADEQVIERAFEAVKASHRAA
ncbi:MAG: tRNA dihydrouridine(20/20a) synthase DusA [Rhizobiaceae bacterium]